MRRGAPGRAAEKNAPAVGGEGAGRGEWFPACIAGPAPARGGERELPAAPTGGARTIPAAGVQDPYEPRRREKFIPRGQWESNHAHAARSTPFTGTGGPRVGRKLLYFSNKLLIENDISDLSIF